MKKNLLYSAVAVVLGLLLTLVPLITDHYLAMPNSLPEKLETLDGNYGFGGYSYSAADVKVFAISFVVAFVVYMLFKRRRPHRDYRWVGPYPY